MVDRITPAPTDATAALAERLTGFGDAAPWRPSRSPNG
jgi:mannitol-1-phosphate/altronate dehydrogenase